jgi:serine/threonine-protein kinase RsbW
MGKIISAFRLTSRLSRLGGLSERLDVVVTAAGATAEEAESLDRGVIEAVSNVIKHGYGGRSNMPMKVVVGCTPEGLQIDVFDSGPAIPPAVIATMRGTKSWDPSDRPAEIGDGLPTISACVDGVAYNRRCGVNRLRLSKVLAGTISAASEGVLAP